MKLFNRILNIIFAPIDRNVGSILANADEYSAKLDTPEKINAKYDATERKLAGRPAFMGATVPDSLEDLKEIYRQSPERFH